MNTDAGIVHLSSSRSPVATIDRVEELARARGLVIFARIDFAHDAAAVGLRLRPMVQLVFGNPRAGTPLLASHPTLGLELPLRALAWEDEAGRSWLSYLAPDRLAERHGVPRELQASIAGIAALCREAASQEPTGSRAGDSS